MLEPKPLSSLIISIIVASSVLLLASCSVVPKDYPDKPFVYKTNINLEGKFSKDEKDALTSQLKNQLDDSMRVRTVYKLFYKGFNRSVLVRPPVFDSASADRSMLFMKSLLNKLGYLRDSISYDTAVTIVEASPPQLRTTVTFNVVPNQLFKIDSVSHVINNDELQALTDASKQKTLLKKGDPFAQLLISDELNRLVELYRENGYLKFSFEELAGVWDTLNLAILRPTIDPFDIIMLEELRRRRDSPTVDIEVRLRPGYDVEKLKKYFVGNTTVYPDFNPIDTAGRVPARFVYDSSFTFVSYRNLFKKKFIAQNIYFKRGDLYNQKRFVRTISRFNEIGAWRLVNIEQIPRDPTDTVDFEIYLTPASKYSFTANIEGSFNNSNSIILQENLLGIGANVQLVNTNFARSANRGTTTARYSTEVDLKGQFIKTVQGSLTHTIVFPKPIMPFFRGFTDRFRDKIRTNLTFSLANTERKDFFNLTSLNASWGYNLQWQNKAAYLKFPNIEYAHVIRRDSLERFLDSFPTLKTVFPENGLVLSTQGGFSIRGGKGRNSQIFRTNIEASGLLSGLIDLKILNDIFKFVKVDAEFIRNMRFNKTSLVFRSFIGAGFAMTTKERPTNPNLPFFKQFTAGGPYSMRAWGIRLLGPGSTLLYRDSVPVRFGDFQFETNLEYRFPLFKIGSYAVNSCVFTDIGNVWFIRKNPDFPDGTITASKFFKDLAVGIGTGLRFDFDFLLIRFDYGVRVKNPSPQPDRVDSQNKWFYNFKPMSGIIQLGINYPFAF